MNEAKLVYQQALECAIEFTKKRPAEFKTKYCLIFD